MPLPLFAFGTLRDSDVLEVVLERAVLGIDRVPARLRGYRVARLPDESYPVLIESRGDSADGLLLRGLSEDDFHRIAFFENTEYKLERCRVELADAGEADA
ncbi:MAG TPA: gamma-glutamylcyclotransferase family protein, partial [Gammaproteobacteria bacterium]|nr:gamma-glutamylcyclotransferase family protein [Gammaproteobacteria bacterium]